MGTCKIVCPNCGAKCAEDIGHRGDCYHEPPDGDRFVASLEGTGSVCLFGRWNEPPKFGKRA